MFQIYNEQIFDLLDFDDSIISQNLDEANNRRSTEQDAF